MLSALLVIIVGQSLDVIDLVRGFPDPDSRVFDGPAVLGDFQLVISQERLVNDVAIVFFDCVWGGDLTVAVVTWRAPLMLMAYLEVSRLVVSASYSCDANRCTVMYGQAHSQ
mgnify:CR=1 FL=1